ncbi:putative nuclease HARBI1 [Zingiber officinale]|uniref:putative nuclease HARBI1 n=1 Tax=Zingiber officinale TaxID=94328 RepID=UPI001C4CD90E|nr:putative nuclease HARBI1 [Zingiber officinale]
MTHNPDRSMLQEFWRNELAEDAEDIDERRMLQLYEQRQMVHQRAQSSSSRTQRRRYLNRDREVGHARLFNDYFSDDPVYPDDIFRRRFRMKKELFLRIVDAVKNHSEYFQWKVDATGKKGLSPLQKCTAVIRQLAYGAPADHYDEYLRIAETTAIQCLFNFCRCVIEVFGAQYLRRHNAADIQHLLEMHEQRHGFPGMLGSLDCMHWQWKNCPVAWKGQFTRGDHGVPTIVFEAVASSDLWIWHAFFGIAGSRNDINVLNESPLFNDVLQGNAPEVNFTINNTQYTKGYYLTDGIYPEWATFVKSFLCPQDPKRKIFKERQEAARKDVERAFGVLQSRWAMIKGSGRFWYKDNLKDIMYTCIILHNMIIENEGDAVVNWSDDERDSQSQIFQCSTQEFQAYIRRNYELRDNQLHHQLRADLVEYIWARYNCNQ